jgi:hypothetical protein
LFYGIVWSQQWDAVSAATASAIFAAVSAIAAAYNARSFVRQSRNNTIDECVSAARGVLGAINRALRVKVDSAANTGSSELWEAYTDAWSAWREFDQKHAVVKGYVSNNAYPKDAATSLANLLERIRPAFKTDWKTDAQKNEAEFKQEAKTIVDAAVDKLQSALHG